MKNLRWALLLAALMLLLPASKNCSQTTNAFFPSMQSQEQALPSLGSENKDERVWAAWSLRLRREETIQKLLMVLNRDFYPDNRRMDAVTILGDYRAAEAVPFLVGHLEWDTAVHEKVSKAIWGYAYIPGKVLDELNTPVSTALAKIGMPAVPVLLDRIKETDDSKIIEKCVFICREIEGQEVTQFRLQQLLTKEIDPKKKVRIQCALGALEKIKRGEL